MFRNLFLLSAFALSLLAQNPNSAVFPARVVTDTDLLVGSNLYATSLSGSIGSADVVIPVGSVLGFTAPGTVTIGTEVIEICSISGSSLVACASGRGFDGTTAAAASWGAPVRGLIVSAHHNQPAAEIKAIENALGPNMLTFEQAINAVPLAAYNFTQHPSGSLTGGFSNSITLAPCPMGISPTDANHWIRVSGTGTPESLLITGGTTGSTSCSINVTPLYNHSAGYTASSATSGIAENISALGASGGVVNVPPGTYSLFAHPVLTNGVTLKGAGKDATILQIATGAYTGLAWVVPSFVSGGVAVYPYTAAVAFATGCVNCRVENLTVDIALQVFNAANTNGPGPNASAIAQQQGGIAGGSMVGPVVDSVSVINWPATDGVPISFFGASTNGLIARSRGTGSPNCVIVPIVTGPGFVFVQGGPHMISENYVINPCDEAYVANFSHDVVISRNEYVAGSAVIPAGAGFGAMHCEDSYHCSIVNNNIIGNYVASTGPTGNAAPAYAILAEPAGGLAGADVTDVLIDGNHVTNAGSGIVIGSNFDSTTTNRRTIVSNNVVTGSEQNGISLQGQIVDLDIHDNSLYSNGQAGIGMFANGLGGGSFLNVSIHDNIIRHNGTAAIHGSGIVLNSASTCAVENLNVRNNFIGDDSTGAVQQYGILRQPAAQFICQHGNISANSMTGNLTAGIGGGSGQFGASFTNADWKNGVLGPNYDGLFDANIAGDSTAPDSSTFNNDGTKAYQSRTKMTHGTLNGSGQLSITFDVPFSNINSYFCTANDDSGSAGTMSVSRIDGGHVLVLGSASRNFALFCHGS